VTLASALVLLDATLGADILRGHMISMNGTRLARLVATLLLGGLALAGAPARAATAGGTVGVTATVPNACVITTAPFSFGNYVPLTTNASTPLDATGTLTVQCTAGSGQGVGLGDGLNYSASRRLQNGTSYLTYELYQDPGRSARWGDAIVGERYTTGFPFATTGLLTLTIYGRVFAGQMVAAGSYTDTVSATVYF